MHYMLEKVDHSGYRIGAMKQVDTELVDESVYDFVHNALVSDNCTRISHAILYDHNGKIIAAENA